MRVDSLISSRSCTGSKQSEGAPGEGLLLACLAGWLAGCVGGRGAMPHLKGLVGASIAEALVCRAA